MSVSASLTNIAVTVPLDLGEILVTILIAPKAIVKLDRIHAFEYISLGFMGAKVAKICEISAV